MARKTGSFSKARPNRDKRQRAWASMRYLARFTSSEIQATAEIGRDNLKRYLKALHSAGFIRIAQEKRNGMPHGHTVWLLARNSGPKHPLALKDGRVYDPNTSKLWGQDGKEVSNEHSERMGKGTFDKSDRQRGGEV